MSSIKKPQNFPHFYVFAQSYDWPIIISKKKNAMVNFICI